MSKSTQGQLHNSWHNFSKYRPLIRELVTRDLKVKYRRSVLGYVWSILNPLLMMLLQTLVFSYMFRFDIPNFPLYLICGNTLFNFFNESTNMGMGSVLGNASLIKKVYVPKFIFPISRVVSSFVNLLFSLAAILLVMLITRSPFYWTILLVWVPLLLLLAFCCGMAVRNTAVLPHLGAAALHDPGHQAEPAVPLHQLHALPCHVRHGARHQYVVCLHRQCGRRHGRRAGRVP